MTRLDYLLQHWDQIVVYLSVAGRGATAEWLRISAPYLLAVLGSAAVALIVVREQVSGIKAQVDTGILPRAEERIRKIDLEIIEIRRQHDLMLEVMNNLQENSPVKCFQCHMRQTKDHPAARK